MGYIYKITNLLNNKCYIGQTINKARRFSDYKYCRNIIKRQPKIYNAISKYSWENFSIEVIEECKKDFLNNRERYWQEYYCSVENGYNCYYTSTIEKPLICSEESKEKLKKYRTGKKHSIETRLKISDRNKIKIYQYTLQGVFIQEWESISEAKNSLNIKLMTPNTFAGGFFWSIEKHNNVPARQRGKRDKIRVKIINTFTKEILFFESLTEAAVFIKTNRQRVKRYVNVNKVINNFKIYSN